MTQWLTNHRDLPGRNGHCQLYAPKATNQHIMHTIFSAAYQHINMATKKEIQGIQK
jgi:hypothetical protein